MLTERQDQVSKIVESLSDELGAIEVKLVGELTSLQQTVNVDVKKQLSSLDQD
eukprot:COSAG01_NODE_63371_length_280_cov_0.834254_1_plen_52_part_01